MFNRDFNNDLFNDSHDYTDSDELRVEEDLLMEQILDNINNTPIGQVLKQIALLPEVRQEKVLEVRGQLNKGKYSLKERLDIALDRVLEELMI